MQFYWLGMPKVQACHWIHCRRPFHPAPLAVPVLPVRKIAIRNTSKFLEHEKHIKHKKLMYVCVSVYTWGMPGMVGVARCMMSSMTWSRGLTSNSRPSGVWVAMICFIITLSSDEVNKPRSALLCWCILEGTIAVELAMEGKGNEVLVWEMKRRERYWWIVVIWIWLLSKSFILVIVSESSTLLPIWSILFRPLQDKHTRTFAWDLSWWVQSEFL